MCFSASASFVAAGVLGATGINTLRHAKTKKRVPFAALPLLFGIQQAIEGAVWISSDIPWLNALATNMFVFFSHVLWPAYVPLAVFLIEKKKNRRKILKALLFIGVVTSLAAAFCTFMIGAPVSVASACGIVYKVYLPLNFFTIGLYILTVCLPCFVSSHKFIRIFGAALLVFGAFSFWFFQATFFSTWCFFAAILSLIIFLHFRPDFVKKIKKILSFSR